MADRVFDTDCWPAQEGAPEVQELLAARVREVADEQERNDGRRPTRLAMTERSYLALLNHPEAAAPLQDCRTPAQRLAAMEAWLGLLIEVLP